MMQTETLVGIDIDNASTKVQLTDCHCYAAFPAGYQGVVISGCIAVTNAKRCCNFQDRFITTVRHDYLQPRIIGHKKTKSSSLANAIVMVHFFFIVFVVCGGLLVIRWPRMTFVHLPAAGWGASVEIFGWICPLTPLENHFRQLAGGGSYGGDFIVRYLIPVIYPENMTAMMQQIFGGLVISMNIVFYAITIRKRRP